VDRKQEQARHRGHGHSQFPGVAMLGPNVANREHLNWQFMIHLVVCVINDFVTTSQKQMDVRSG